MKECDFDAAELNRLIAKEDYDGLEKLVQRIIEEGNKPQLLIGPNNETMAWVICQMDSETRWQMSVQWRTFGFDGFYRRLAYDLVIADQEARKYIAMEGDIHRKMAEVAKEKYERTCRMADWVVDHSPNINEAQKILKNTPLT